MTIKVSDIKSIILKLASPEEILSWSHGEVTKPETINYRTQRPEKDGLFCERIFGPTKDYECYCGKYKRVRYKGVVCERCGVEVTSSSVRRERMGHIKLAVPVSHIWFLRGVPSRMGLLLDKSAQELEKVIYFTGYIITEINEEARKKAIEEIEREYKTKLKEQNAKRKNKTGDTNISNSKIQLKEQRDKAIREVRELHKWQILSEREYKDLSLKYGQVFRAGTGAEILREIFKQIDLEKLAKELEKKRTDKNINPEIKKKISKRLRFVKGLIRAKLRPEWMFLTVLPIIPPELRPMVPLDGGRYATSDVNDLYRRVINRNNRLKRLMEINAPEVICRNEKRMLQEAVDALIDNSARKSATTVTATTGGKRALKSLADMLKGKQGRFRQNLLGKRVDYSGRSVIVVGPNLRIDQCGLPKHMALELFKPFVINKLVEKKFAQNVKIAGRLIEEKREEIWGVLEEVIKDKYVLLNRAPTLHRLGIQAFRPVLIEGQAIQLHPLVCVPFNADFDGDQMAVHLPLSEMAQKEAKEIMLSSKNLLKPASGQPVVFPRQDMVLGCYWMTKIIKGAKGEGKIFANEKEALLAYHFKDVDLRAEVKIRRNNYNSLKDESDGKSSFIKTSVGRIIFNEAIPKEIGFINRALDQKELRKLVAELIEKCGIEKTTNVLDKIKRMGFKYATMSGISWGMDDTLVPKIKNHLLKQAEKEIRLINSRYEEGLLTEEERKIRVIQVWSEVKDKIAKEVIKSIPEENPINYIFSSGSRGSKAQLIQMCGMKGLVVSPTGETLELPVKSSFKEGFDVLEYFISTHGARKGLTDTALKTSSAGYLTRRLVDVCQDIVINEEDCGDTQGIYIYREDGEEFGQTFAERITGRVSLQEVKIEDGGKKKVIITPGQLIDKNTAEKIDKSGIDKLRVRSVITCKAKFGVCQKCYGYDLSYNRLVKLGEAVGVVTAQAIGEPGTQLTMRTFHTGGVAGGGDITQGLPRVEEIFEVRLPRGKAVVSQVHGRVKDIIKKDDQTIIKIELTKSTSNPKKKKDNKSKSVEICDYVVPSRMGIWVEKGDLVAPGTQLCEGHLDLKELYKIAGKEAVQRYIIKEVQSIYSSEGEHINDKHIEMIIRQMFSRARIKDPGDTMFLPGQIVERGVFDEENEKIKKSKGKQATCQTLLLGVSKVALSTYSWLSAASFQETARVLIDAAVQGKEDPLRGLKENVIIGKLIPAGTGFRKGS